MSELVSTNWLLKNLKNKELTVLDCSWHMPIEKRNPKNEYNKIHIENSYFFNIDKISRLIRQSKMKKKCNLEYLMFEIIQIKRQLIPFKYARLEFYLA